MSSIRERVSPEEWNLRVNLAAAYRLVADFGWTDLVFTHISVRVPGPERHFLINPYDMLFEEITASSLVKIDLQGNVVLDNGHPVNAAGFTIHSAIHEAREDAHAIIHLHTLDGTAVSCLKEGLLPLSQTAQLICGDIAYHEYEGVAFDPAEKPRLQKDLGQKNILILRNHGTLTVGETIAQAFVRMYFLERACSMQVRTLAQLGPERHLHPSAPEVIAKNIEIGRFGLTAIADHLIWPALLRRLNRTMPGYDT
ncbi:MAG: class II aldolase/adducin family protein [Sandaracinaceae bacterium]|nr:class II aldolase/adducin family protein [Sandaracinaceae bacterium]MDW8247385.1 class II aldolase/adducin family protein [Sandaracinaceae bacterium]